jgi:uncharacterized protein
MNTITDLDWPAIYESLNTRGYAHLPGILSAQECAHLQGLYEDEKLYRSVIDMQRYRFGSGRYKYFQYPLPSLVQTLRQTFYERLYSIANTWMSCLSIDISYPAAHSEMIKLCHVHEQMRPTPLILRYESGGHNTLHQDLYGDVYFPFQVVFVLTEPGRDHHGGELVLTEHIPRAQSKAQVISPQQGDAVIFTTNFRPVKGTRGYYRATFRHGVSEVTSGIRYALGLIFHDAS